MQCCSTLQTAFNHVSRVVHCCSTLQTAFNDVSRVVHCCSALQTAFHSTLRDSCSAAPRCKQHFTLLFSILRCLLHIYTHIRRFWRRLLGMGNKGGGKNRKRNGISTAAAQWSDIAPHAGTALGVPSCGHMKDRSTDARGREMYSQGCNFAVFLSPAAHEEWDRSGAGEPSPLLYTTTRAWRERRRDEGRGLGKSAESEFWIWGWRQ